MTRYVPLPAWRDLDVLDTVDVTDRAWTGTRNCVGHHPNIFHPPAGPKGSNRAWYLPAQICAACPVRYQCLADWLTHPPRGPDDHAYVGGTTPEQRRTIRTTRQGAAA